MTEPGAARPGERRQRAGIVVIGNEVLSRKVADRNTDTILATMARHGVVVAEVAILPDVQERIAAVVADFAARFDLVVTTGGVGPTHDDCTWRAVADALGRPIVRHEPLLAAMKARLGGHVTPEQERMAHLPRGAEVVLEAGAFFLHVGAVYVLPGVPSMVSRHVEIIAQRHAGDVPVLANVYFTAQEWHVVAAIDAVVAGHPGVDIGSYPIFDADDHHLRLTVESGDAAAVRAAVAALIEGIGADTHVRTEFADRDGEGEQPWRS